MDFFSTVRQLSRSGHFPIAGSWAVLTLWAVTTFLASSAYASETHTEAAPPPLRFLIVVPSPSASSPDGANSQQKSLCVQIFQTLQAVTNSSVESGCAISNDPETIRKQLATHAYDILLELSQNPWKMKAQILKIRGFPQLHRLLEHPLIQDHFHFNWNLPQDLALPSLLLHIRPHLVHLSEASQNLRLVIESFLLYGVQNEKSSVEILASGKYRDRKTQQELRFEEALLQFLNEDQKKTHFFKAALEIAVSLGLGTIQYQLSIASNREDWQLEVSWETLRKKLTGEVWSFDNNNHVTNLIAHPFAGSLYYILSRSNGFGSFSSFLFSLSASLVWEVLIEVREHVSIGDMIYTPIAGAVIGEVFHQLAELALESESGGIASVLGVLFGSVHRLNHWINQVPIRKFSAYKRSGLSAKWTSELSLRTLAGGLRRVYLNSSDRASSSRSPQNLMFFGAGFESQIIRISELTAPGNESRFILKPILTQLRLEGRVGTESYADIELLFKAAFAGYYAKSIQKNSEGNLSGYSFLLSLSSAYQLNYRSETSEHPTQVNGIVDVIGSTLRITLYLSGIQLEINAQVHGDFGTLSSLSIRPWIRQAKNYQVQSTLIRGLYTYQYGISSDAQVKLTFSSFELGASASTRRTTGILGRDRFDSELMQYIPSADRQDEWKFWISCLLPENWARIRLQYARIYRESHLGETFDRYLEHQLMGSFEFLF